MQLQSVLTKLCLPTREIVRPCEYIILLTARCGLISDTTRNDSSLQLR